MTDTFETYSTFRPFGDGVRVGTYGNPANAEISANLKDLCIRYSVDYEQAKKIPFPGGSILMLQIARGGLATELYLSEDAYHVFMAWVVEAQG